jgi:hypothetical protein
VPDPAAQQAVRTFRNLVGVPSAHYDPHFAQAVRHAFVRFNPTVVALELPASTREELEWARACWPTPVVSYSGSSLFPFIPGDSMVEGYRQAMERGTPVALVDLDTDGGNHQPMRVLGPDLARAEPLYSEVQTLLFEAGGAPAPLDLAREAHMGRLLSDLMREQQTVLWIGGMYHWERIIERLESERFDGPAIPTVAGRRFQRMRLAPSALHHITQRLPWMVSRYAADPDGYDETDATRELALRALPLGDGPIRILRQIGAVQRMEEPIEGTPADVARVLLFARNLAMTRDMRIRPNIFDLITAAAATIDAYYAGRLFELAVQEDVSTTAAAYPALEWEGRGGIWEFRLGDEQIIAEPWFGAPATGGRESLLTITQVENLVDLLADLPDADTGSKRYWGMLPWEEAEYAEFVSYILRRASIADPEEATSAPFLSGLADGLDLRETIRHWQEGAIYVRHERRGRMNFTNGAVDWVNPSEQAAGLQGRLSEGGWIDPSSTWVGTASRETESGAVLREHPYHLQMDRREFTLLSLDSVNWAGEDHAEETFYRHVIRPLVDIQRTPKDTVYGWLEIMFQYCQGKPFVYYSRYVPSPRIYALASRHNVKLVHAPLHQIPARLLRKHQTFRFLELTPEQWEEIRKRRSLRTDVWGNAQGA